MQGWIEISPGVFVSPQAAAAAGAGSVNRDRTQAERDAMAREAERLRQAEERKRIAEGQLAKMQELQAQASAQSAANAAYAVTQREYYEGQRADLAVKQKKNLEAGLAVGSSLRILSGQQPKQGRRASISSRGKRAGGPRATTSSLRIGNTGRGYGSGNNLSI
jgi:hypothetical protein